MKKGYMAMNLLQVCQFHVLLITWTATIQVEVTSFWEWQQQFCMKIAVFKS